MGGTANLVVQRGSAPRQTLAELVMAWARDTETGEPRHILELGVDRRGAKCGCECPSCGLALTAVNAAKEEFVKRPHFLHPEGAERNACMLLTARAALLRQRQVDGWLELPRRRVSSKVAGLSGQFHEAWVELPAEKLHINVLTTSFDGHALVQDADETADDFRLRAKSLALRGRPSTACVVWVDDIDLGLL